MAKKINTENPAVTEQTGENITRTTDTGIPAEMKTGAETPEPGVIDEQVMSVLKVYPNYENLYVDRHGSAYTTDTPAILRKGAGLYNNPFYKLSKTQN